MLKSHFCFKVSLTLSEMSMPEVKTVKSQKKLRVLLLCDFFSSLGGTEYYNYELAKGLIDRGHEVRIYVGERARRNEWQSKIEELGIPFAQPNVFHKDLDSREIEINFMDTVVDEINEWRPDVIHTHPFKKMAIVWLSHKRSDKSIPIVATEWTVPTKQASHWFEDDINEHISDVSLFIATCEAAARGIHAYHGYKGKIIEIPHIIRNMPEKPLPITDTNLTSVGCVGRFSTEKGIAFLIGAWRQVQAQLPGASLHLYGHGADEDALKELARCLGVADSVHFAGTFEPGTLPEVAQNHAFFVQPSLFESIPTSLIELMMCGRAIVASDVGGIAEVVKNGRNGFIVEPGSTDQLADAIVKLLSSREKIFTFAKQAHVDAHQRYNANKAIDSIVDAYYDVSTQWGISKNE